MDKHDIFVALGQALFAVFGSCVKWLNEKDVKSRRIASLIAEAMSAAFTGTLIYFIYAWLDLNIYLAFCMAGIIGNQGARGLDMLGKFIIKNSVFTDIEEKKEA